eukprot:scpid103308/ scgid16420/ 
MKSFLKYPNTILTGVVDSHRIIVCVCFSKFHDWPLRRFEESPLKYQWQFLYGGHRVPASTIMLFSLHNCCALRGIMGISCDDCVCLRPAWRISTILHEWCSSGSLHTQKTKSRTGSLAMLLPGQSDQLQQDKTEELGLCICSGCLVRTRNALEMSYLASGLHCMMCTYRSTTSKGQTFK